MNPLISHHRSILAYDKPNGKFRSHELLWRHIFKVGFLKMGNRKANKTERSRSELLDSVCRGNQPRDREGHLPTFQKLQVFRRRFWNYLWLHLVYLTCMDTGLNYIAYNVFIPLMPDSIKNLSNTRKIFQSDHYTRDYTNRFLRVEKQHFIAQRQSSKYFS